MFGVGAATRIYLALGSADMRKGAKGLYDLVRDFGILVWPTCGS